MRRLDHGRVLLGGDPGRLVRLRTAGAAALDDLVAGGVPTGAALALARSLVASGLAHPRPRAVPVAGVTVVVPVRDRVDALVRCLAGLGADVPILVVDDGSDDPAAVARSCRAAGVRLLVLPANAGPAAARNAGVAVLDTPYLAFLDSDCVPPPGWLSELMGHFADPAVAAVAPRVGAAGGRSLLARYASARGPLDLGVREAAVRPGSRVPYVPTAALVVRRDALAGAAPFDATLRYGEDVDLVWRLHDQGWTVRYDPRTLVRHDEPDRWAPWLLRRHRYGTSAAPLAQRHGGRLTPLVLRPWPALAWLLLLTGRTAAAAAAAAVPAGRLYGRLRRTALPVSVCAGTSMRATAQGVLATGRGVGGAGTVVTGPVLLALLACRRTRRTATFALLAPPLLEWVERRPALDPVRWTALRLLDDLAYASGVWAGCLRRRSLAPLQPRLTRPV